MAPQVQTRGTTTNGEHPRLEPGARGLAVMELKRLLRRWYEQRGERLPRRMRGPVYGTSAVEAVKHFQQERGLKIDGIVDAETWRALTQ